MKFFSTPEKLSASAFCITLFKSLVEIPWFCTFSDTAKA
jgi:hypothetical protein